MGITKKLLTKIGKFLFNLLFEKNITPSVNILFKKPNRKVNKVFIHCSGSDRPEDQSYERVEFLHTFKKGHLTTWGKYGKEACKGWKYIGYHFYITKDGTIHKGRPLEVRPSAQKGYNSGTIAICVAGEKEFTDDSLLALVDLCEEIHKSYEKITFHGHKEVDRNRTCPNFDYGGWLNLFDDGVMDKD